MVARRRRQRQQRAAAQAEVEELNNFKDEAQLLLYRRDEELGALRAEKEALGLRLKHAESVERSLQAELTEVNARVRWAENKEYEYR